MPSVRKRLPRFRDTGRKVMTGSVKKVIGILGGMGPLATADLYKKIVLNTDAGCDQEHIHTIIDSNTAIPDRTAALLNGAASPIAEMVKSAKTLEKAGADIIIMPCNTAHNYHSDIEAAVSVPVLHMIRLTKDSLKRKGIVRAGLLATDGTIRTRIYQKCFEGSGIELLLPGEAEQRAVMDMIYRGVKAGKAGFDASAAGKAAEALIKRGAQTLILGCTELPLAFELYGLDLPAVDPTLELALGAIRAAGGRVKGE